MPTLSLKRERGSFLALKPRGHVDVSLGELPFAGLAGSPCPNGKKEAIRYRKGRMSMSREVGLITPDTQTPSPPRGACPRQRTMPRLHPRAPRPRQQLGMDATAVAMSKQRNLPIASRQERNSWLGSERRHCRFLAVNSFSNKNLFNC